MKHLEPFALNDTTLEEVGRRLGRLYENVTFSREPMFAWVQIMNDVTIMGEELRRERHKEAVQQAGDILTRMLEFLGYYMFVHKIDGNADFADFVATTLRAPAYSDYAPPGLQDGPSWWVLYKYPFACAKCGQSPCHCLVEPWTLENRREDPGPYLAKFRKVAEEARDKLRSTTIQQLTIADLIDHFKRIYRASYYHQDPWKIGMHLSEELGEAMTELTRLEIVFRASKTFDLKAELGSAFQITRYKLDRETDKIKDPANRQQRNAQLVESLNEMQLKLAEGDPWKIMSGLIGERFKEEVADILSWLSAIVVKLDPELEALAAMPKKFLKVTEGGINVLQCPWCRSESCSDRCLVLHGVSGEIREIVSKF